jgi:hypothetical protein
MLDLTDASPTTSATNSTLWIDGRQSNAPATPPWVALTGRVELTVADSCRWGVPGEQRSLPPNVDLIRVAVVETEPQGPQENG